MVVSIIVPVYNKEEFVKETLDSVLAQTYTKFELILVNDGSTDDSLKILKSYADRFPEKIHLIDSVNKGVSAATNLGIQASKGDYIQFLDADDCLSPDKIERQIVLLKDKSPNVMASCDWLMFRDDIGKHFKVPYGIFGDFESGLDWLVRAWNYQEMMQPAAWLTHRDLILKSGPWNEKLTINQDGEFFCRVLSHCQGIIYDSKGKVYYRIPGESNVSQQKSKQAFASLLESYRCYEENVIPYENSERMRIALKKVYQKFVYDVFPNFPELIAEAEKSIENLGVNIKTYIGGNKFQSISKILGFKNALRLKKFLESK